MDALLGMDQQATERLQSRADKMMAVMRDAKPSSDDRSQISQGTESDVTSRLRSSFGGSVNEQPGNSRGSKSTRKKSKPTPKKQNSKK